MFFIQSAQAPEFRLRCILEQFAPGSRIPWVPESQQSQHRAPLTCRGKFWHWLKSGLKRFNIWISIPDIPETFLPVTVSLLGLLLSMKWVFPTHQLIHVCFDCLVSGEKLLGVKVSASNISLEFLRALIDQKTIPSQVSCMQAAAQAHPKKELVCRFTS